ncbi:helix-turn-helix transcriptional regulator [Arthrobacter agilis]|uniref:helix-turn-helix transcriptional regulator n=1 Tax=Arthrobacter agilis TaxID=37921 RepID=UPI00278941FB|nr:LuxR family transcriptional regulator [Arthrobacter agilis]MDQ0734060.1 DNA-binding CsgD family transcriptional regulator [Arthrobacter agilis]
MDLLTDKGGPAVMNGDYTGAWPLLGRSEETTAILAGLAATGSAGVLIVGASGVGKTALGRAAAAQLEGTTQVILIRGSAAMTTTPYGALSVLLMDVDPADSVESLPMLQSLQAALRIRARNRPVILMVDNVHHLDDPSVRVLSYLAEVGAARLLVACDGPAPSSARFFDLWRSGRLVRVDVAPLTFERTRSLLGQLLGAPVSGTAAVELWRASRGNLRSLQAAVRGDIARGALTRDAGAWVWHRAWDGIPVQGNDGAPTALTALSERARQALDVVAVAAPVPLDALLPSCGAEIIDELEQAGVCVVDPEAPHAVTVVNGVIGDRLRGALAANPLPAFLERLRGLDDGGHLPVPARLNLLRWFLDAEVPLQDGYLRGVARAANDAGEPRVALLAAEHLADIDPADLVQVRTCLERLRFSEAGAVLGRILTGDATPSDPARSGGSDPVTVEGVAHEGRFRDVLDLTGAEVHRNQPKPLDIENTARLVLARSLTGTGPGAKRSLARLHGAGLPVPTGTAGRLLQESGFAALVYEGYLQDALLLTGAPTLAAGQWEDPSVADTLTGTALAALGHGEAALAVILPAVEQLRVDNRSGLLPLAEAAAAYASALRDGQDADRPGTKHSRDSASAEHLPWMHRSMIVLLHTLADALVSDSDAAARRFVVLAAAQRQAGNAGAELLLRMHAVRLGQQSQAPLLLDLARGIDTPLARAAELLARGVAARDPLILLQAAESAFGLGHLDLAGSAALISMRLHDADDEPLHFIRAEQIFRRTSVPRRNASARRILTDRERAFARMAARGATNKEVAAAHHLSVRTVEGHILKAMAKLGVSSRTQLSTVFTQ